MVTGDALILKDKLSAKAATAVEKGLAFLEANQRADGEFNSYRARDPLFLADCEFDSSPFPTSLIAYCLSQIDSPKCKRMIEKACAFLIKEMEPGGVWRYWTSQHQFHAHIPLDLDDIACVSSVLKQNGYEIPDNRSIICGNRDFGGRFYTWIVPRFGFPGSFQNFIQVLKSARNPISLYYFWKLNESAPDDVDSVVNANVVSYLGECTETRGAISYLIDLISQGQEELSDKWHLSPYNLYYALSRNYKDGMKCFEAVRAIIIEQIMTKPDQLVPETILDTALALCTAGNFDHSDQLLDNAYHMLLSEQQTDGSWKAMPLYWGGPKKYFGWGSKEITTAFCLEALVRYRLTRP